MSVSFLFIQRPFKTIANLLNDSVCLHEKPWVNVRNENLVFCIASLRFERDHAGFRVRWEVDELIV